MQRWAERPGETGGRNTGVTVGQVGVAENEMTGDVVG